MWISNTAASKASAEEKVKVYDPTSLCDVMKVSEQTLTPSLHEGDKP